MSSDLDVPAPQNSDEEYFEADSSAEGLVFDAHILREPLSVLPTRPALIFAASDSASDAMRAMQKEHRGCVLVTEDGSANTRLTGIFTERDVLERIIDRGRNPANLPLAEVMVSDPESVPNDATIAWVLNKMSVGGFRHVPAVDPSGRPTLIVSVRDVVQFLVNAFPSEILNLPPEYGTEGSRRREGA
jgi:CBS domain-containing protein